MVLTLAVGALLTVVGSWFFVSAVASIINVLAIVGSVVAGVAFFYQLFMARPLDLPDFSAIPTYSSLGVAVIFIVFRLLQSVVSTVSSFAALAAGLAIVGSIVLSPQLVAGGIKSFYEFLSELLSG